LLNVVAVESLYSAMCECQALHPDENDSLSEGAFLFANLSVLLFYVYDYLCHRLESEDIVPLSVTLCVCPPSRDEGIAVRLECF